MHALVLHLPGEPLRLEDGRTPPGRDSRHGRLATVTVMLVLVTTWALTLPA